MADARVIRLRDGRTFAVYRNTRVGRYWGDVVGILTSSILAPKHGHTL